MKDWKDILIKKQEFKPLKYPFTMNKTIELTFSERWEILALVNKEIRDAEQNRKDWIGDEEEDFSASLFYDNKINNLTEIKNKII